MESLQSTPDAVRANPIARARAAASAHGESAATLADLAVFGGLLALTAAFGRGFSRIGFDGPSIYVTEVALAIAAVLAIRRLGLARIAELIRERVPLAAMGAFWLAAVVAFVAGVRSYGLNAVIEDVGLGEYSLLVPLIAAVASTRWRERLLTRVLVAGLVAGTAVYAFSDLSVRLFDAEGTFFDVQEITFGLYMSMLVGFVAARIACSDSPAPALVTVAAIALVLVFLSNARGVWLSVLVGLATVAVLAPAGVRLRFGAGALVAVVCAFTLALGIQELGGGSQISNEVTGAVNGVSGKPATSTNSSESANATWRLAFWREILARAPDHPLFGVGYGEPIAFTWHGLKYDFRDGDPNARMEVDGPHNEFLHVLYRMGLVGLAGLVGAIAVALWRALRVLRRGSLDPGRRALLTGLAAMLLVTCTVAGFADSLKSPFLGIFFWSALGLLLVAAGGRDGPHPGASR